MRELLRYAADDVLPLSGTQSGEAGQALILALTSFSGTSCVLAGQDRLAQARGRPLGPAALRGARRGMRIAQELRLPLVCVIDTPGAELSAAAEEGALSGEIARCLAELTQLTVPTVSVLLGQGTGGGALAVHAVVPEPVPAHADPAAFSRRIADECLRQIYSQQPSAPS